MTVSRRNILGSAAALSLTTVSVASAQENGNIPQPMRAGHGGTDLGPRDVIRDRENPDVLVPPATDQGTLPNLRFSFADAHNRLARAGWAR